MLASILWPPIIVILSATVGQFMFLAYPFPLGTKILYAAFLAAVAVMIYCGWCSRKKLLGKALILFGVIMWVLAGTLGLGTGT